VCFHLEVASDLEYSFYSLPSAGSGPSGPLNKKNRLTGTTTVADLQRRRKLTSTVQT
jgi:hypothetical protein